MLQLEIVFDYRTRSATTPGKPAQAKVDADTSADEVASVASSSDNDSSIASGTLEYNLRFRRNKISITKN